MQRLGLLASVALRVLTGHAEPGGGEPCLCRSTGSRVKSSMASCASGLTLSEELHAAYRGDVRACVPMANVCGVGAGAEVGAGHLLPVVLKVGLPLLLLNMLATFALVTVIYPLQGVQS